MSSTRSTTSSDKRSDQAAIDAFDEKKWNRRARIRPGDTVTVQGTLPCGKLGTVAAGCVLNACVTTDGEGDQVLVATTVYGRRWFGARGSAYRLVSFVASGV
jgi:hypothetical protein